MKAEVDHTVFGYIEEDRLRRISRYQSEDMTAEKFSDPSTWTDLKDILIYHPDPIVRHEASFVASQLPYHGNLVPYLISVVKFDQSIVAKHEAIEALGNVGGSEASKVYRFLSRIFTQRGYDEGVYHPDVQATIQHSLRELERELALTD